MQAERFLRSALPGSPVSLTYPPGPALPNPSRPCGRGGRARFGESGCALRRGIGAAWRRRRALLRTRRGRQPQFRHGSPLPRAGEGQGGGKAWCRPCLFAPRACRMPPSPLLTHPPGPAPSPPLPRLAGEGAGRALGERLRFGKRGCAMRRGVGCAWRGRRALPKARTRRGRQPQSRHGSPLPLAGEGQGGGRPGAGHAFSHRAIAGCPVSTPDAPARTRPLPNPPPPCGRGGRARFAESGCALRRG